MTILLWEYFMETLRRQSVHVNRVKSLFETNLRKDEETKPFSVLYLNLITEYGDQQIYLFQNEDQRGIRFSVRSSTRLPNCKINNYI